MIEHVGNLVYCLEVSSTMQIHSVVLIVQLESASHEFDLYNCYSHMNSSFIENEQNNNVETLFFYEIEHLLNKWTQKIHDRSVVEYLVKWKRYNHSHNVWYGMKDLANIKKLMKNYEQQDDASELIDDYKRRIHWSLHHTDEIVGFVREGQIVMDRLHWPQSLLTSAFAQIIGCGWSGYFATSLVSETYG